ncbi:MAG: hypothetical protein GC191_09500 [Azospirillum sp.]|nr:hypothetical protein [Azospirillum sp.]
MSVTTSAGTTIAIGTTAADPATDTFDPIGEVTDIGEFGRVYQVIKHQPLASRNTIKRKGARDDGTVQLTLARDLGDAGQLAAKAALDDDGEFNFRIELPDKATPTGHGSRFEFKALVTEFTTNPGNANVNVGAKIKLEISGDITETAAT